MHSPKLLNSHARQFCELTVEIAAVVESALQGNVLNPHIRLLQQQLFNHLNAQLVSP